MTSDSDSNRDGNGTPNLPGVLVRIDGRLHVARPCVVCGVTVYAKRSSKRTCSGRCRMRLMRGRQLVERVTASVTVTAPEPEPDLNRVHQTDDGRAWSDVPLW